MEKYYSDRGLELFYSRESRDIQLPTITVEDYLKWYDLYLVYPSGLTAKISFEHLEDYVSGTESPYVDHCPNPIAVINLARRHQFWVDSDALHAMEEAYIEVNS